MLRTQPRGKPVSGHLRAGLVYPRGRPARGNTERSITPIRRVSRIALRWFTWKGRPYGSGTMTLVALCRLVKPQLSIRATDCRRRSRIRDQVGRRSTAILMAESFLSELDEALL